MTAPALEAARFLTALEIGAALGAFYGFLRPLRPRLTFLSDLVFVAAAFWGWLLLGFGFCGGDLRLSYTCGMAAGGWLWELTAGRLLRPVWRLFWKWTGRILRLFCLPSIKIWDFAKNFLKKLLAFPKKWFTIRQNHRRQNRHTIGGAANGKAEKTKIPTGAAQEQPVAAGPHSRRRGAVHRGAGGAAGLH